MAEGYLLPDTEGKSALDRNRDVLKSIDTLVTIEMVGVAILAGMAFILAFLIGKS